VVPPLVEAWSPEVLVTQLGCDSHFTDPLTNLMLTTAAFRQTATMLHDLAHKAAGGNWVATGGGGYSWASVVPRAWTIYFAEMAGVEIPDAIPKAWLERAERQAGHPLPGRLSEAPVEESWVDEPAVDSIIEQVKDLIFPLHGL
jgi:acetoin utilization protein AcuC